MEEKKINKSIIFSVVAVLLLVVVVIGATVAYFSAQAQTDVQTVTTANLTMGFEAGDIIRATGITPINDSEIKTKATELPFSVTNTGSEHMNLTIKLTDITIDEALKDVDFRWGLYNADTGNGLSFGIFKYTTTEELLYTDTIIDAADPDITKNYILRIWLHDDGALQNEFMGKTFSGKVTVTGEAIEYTPESCFEFDSSTGTIRDTDNDLTAYDTSCGTNVVIPKTIDGVDVKTIEMEVFNTDTKSVIIPDTVTELVGDENFLGVNHLTIPESVTNIIATIPALNPNMNSIFIPETTIYNQGPWLRLNAKVVVLGANINARIYVCEGVEEIILMDGITTIRYSTFDEKPLLTTIELPSSVTVVEEWAFDGWTNLTEIVVRGKTSLDDFEDATGLTTEGGLPEGVNIIFRP